MGGRLSLIFSTIRTGCLVEGLTYDALPRRSVECGSSTAAATPLHEEEDKGTLFFLPFPSLLFSFLLLSLLPSSAAQLFHALTPKSNRLGSRTTVSRRYRTVISNANSPRVTYAGDSCILSRCTLSVNGPNNCRWKVEDKYRAVGNGVTLCVAFTQS